MMLLLLHESITLHRWQRWKICELFWLASKLNEISDFSKMNLHSGSIGKQSWCVNKKSWICSYIVSKKTSWTCAFSIKTSKRIFNYSIIYAYMVLYWYDIFIKSTCLITLPFNVFKFVVISKSGFYTQQSKRRSCINKGILKMF